LLDLTSQTSDLIAKEGDNMIKAGSNSRISIFESCKLRAKLAYIDRIPEPERPPLPNNKEYPNDRGSRVHDYAEFYVRGKHDKLIPELLNFAPELKRLRDLYPSGNVMMEDMWCFDDAWQSVGSREFDKIRFRAKLDVCIFYAGGRKAIVVDYKTGRRVGNEIKHAEQCQQYQLCVFLRFPDVEEVITELWYTDQNELHTMKFTRAQGLRFLKGINQRNQRMLTAAEFPANPSTHSCRWCPYKTGTLGKFGVRGTGHCDKNPI